MLMNFDTAEPKPTEDLEPPKAQVAPTPPLPASSADRSPTGGQESNPQGVYMPGLRSRITDYSSPSKSEDEDQERIRLENRRLDDLAATEEHIYRVQVERVTVRRLREEGRYRKMTSTEIKQEIEAAFALALTPTARYRDRWPTKRTEMAS